MAERPPPPPQGALTPADVAALQESEEHRQYYMQLAHQQEQEAAARVRAVAAAPPTDPRLLHRAEELARLLALLERSPPKPMEVEGQAPASFLAAAASGSSQFLSPPDAKRAPRTYEAWDALCSPLMQKRTLNKMEFVACVLGCAATHGFLQEPDAYASAGTIYSLFQVVNELSAHEYRRVLAAFIESRQTLSFFNNVTVTAPGAAISTSATSLQFAGHPFRTAPSLRRERTPTCEETAAEPAAATKKAREARGVKKEKGGNPGG